MATRFQVRRSTECIKNPSVNNLGIVNWQNTEPVKKQVMGQIMALELSNPNVWHEIRIYHCNDEMQQMDCFSVLFNSGITLLELDHLLCDLLNTWVEQEGWHDGFTLTEIWASCPA